MTTPRLAVFVSPHGFGHAARAAAVMEALHRLAGADFELFTTVPRWFFEASVPGVYRYHEVVTDVGFRQRSALVHDVDATVAALGAFVPFDDALVERLAASVAAAGCGAVLCDIAPLGIVVAERAGLPSVLVESFTWPWLYEPLVEEAPRLGPLAEELDRWLARASLHLLAEPFCVDDPRAHGTVLPVSRPATRTRPAAREALGLAPGAPVVVLTMGGIPEPMPFLPRLRAVAGVTFLVTGAERSAVDGHVCLFGRDTPIHMPTLLRAADAVVAKLGYGTVAEVWREGLPFARVIRTDSRETGPLGRWVEGALTGFAVPAADFSGGDWIERIPELLALPRLEPRSEGGAEQVARRVLDEVLGVTRRPRRP